jgi:glycosyltransferase involved in cell wall biosynthesis
MENPLVNWSGNKTIVISGINITDGGSLSIYKDILCCLEENFSDWTVIALISDKKYFVGFRKTVFYEFPKGKQLIIFRLYYEYIYFKKLSRKINPYFWLSISNVNPNVSSQLVLSYIHNAAPFSKIKLKYLLYGPLIVFQKLVYGLFYKINASNNDYIIVQSSWIAEEMRKIVSTKKTRFLVCNPNSNYTQLPEAHQKNNSVFHFFYPSFTRVFKNFEVVCAAANILVEQGISNFKLILTIENNGTKYARLIYNRYKNNPCIEFIGLIEREEVFDFYRKVDCLVFPSELESWGLPLSEFRLFNKPILAANLPYSGEPLRGYRMAKFFDPCDAVELASYMNKLIHGNLTFDSTDFAKSDINSFFSWHMLFSKFLNNHGE